MLNALILLGQILPLATSALGAVTRLSSLMQSAADEGRDLTEEELGQFVDEMEAADIGFEPIADAARKRLAQASEPE